ncbi:MAG: hypothetical protein V7K18_25080 [Nostoc sp.]|uniref:hypothetical protein n=1 Tax=Nostoc sp. TaxID=1180 RepID=UPI002FF669DB
MAWLDPITLNSVPGRWIVSSVIESDFVKINHQTSGLNNSFFTGTIAQAEIDNNQELTLYDLREVKTNDDAQAFHFPKPDCFTNRRIAFNANPYALLVSGQIWDWSLLISEFSDVPSALPVTKLYYESNGDSKGLFYYLGTVGKTQPWANPTSKGLTIQASTTGSGSVQSIVNRDESEFYTNNIPSSWVSFNIGTSKLKCNCYSIRARNNTAYYIRNWKLQGSDDGSTWIDLDTQTNNTTLANASQWISIPINNASAAYSWFRVLNYGLDSEGHNYFTLGEVELYGEYFEQ